MMIGQRNKAVGGAAHVRVHGGRGAAWDEDEEGRNLGGGGRLGKVRRGRRGGPCSTAITSPAVPPPSKEDQPDIIIIFRAAMQATWARHTLVLLEDARYKRPEERRLPKRTLERPELCL